MDNKYLIIINNNLENHALLIKNIQKALKYQISILSADELLHGKISSNLSSHRIYDVVLAIENTCLASQDKEIRAYFRSLFQTPFTNLLQIFTDPQSCMAVLEQNKEISCFILFENYNIEQATLYFQTHINDLYAKSTIAYRLSDYIYQSFKGVVYSEVLKKKKQEIERLNQELELRNRIDPLTNLFNRRALYEFLEKERNRTLRNLLKIGSRDLPSRDGIQREEEKIQTFTSEFIEGNIIIFSLMMIDLDRFKAINDTHGHLIGDMVLKSLGNLFKTTGILREQDIVGRFGGEEFIIILPGTTSLNAKQPAIRLAAKLASQHFRGADGKNFTVTMSIGISEYHPFDKNGEAIIQRADKALYAAKDLGRNRIISYEEEFPDA